MKPHVTGMLVLATLIIGNLSMVMKNQKYCLQEDTQPYPYMGSRTGYETVRGDIFATKDFNSCRAVKFWSLHRHGTRIAGSDVVNNFRQLPFLRDEIIRNHEDYDRGTLCKKDRKLLKSWQWDESLEGHYNDLTEQGWYELKTIGKRFKKRLPGLFKQKYNETKFYFRYTNEQRTEESCKAFIKGVFGDDRAHVRIETPVPNDPILRPYKNCTAWREEVSEEESDKFQEKPIFKQMVYEISLRLGFNRPLDNDIINLMYETCRFEKAWQPKETSPWCVAFTKTHLLIMEYLDDLQHFFKAGYGVQISPMLGCFPVKDMLQKFIAHVEGTSPTPDVTSYFSHDTMLLMTMATLGVGKDEEFITADNYDTMADRKWRTSLIGAFATNLAAVLYDCHADQERYHVQLLFNEKPLNLCSDSSSAGSQGWCPWSEFYDRLSHVLQCNIEVCNDPSLIQGGYPIYVPSNIEDDS